MEYGKKLNYERSLRTARGIKGVRQKVIVTHNPSEIDHNQLLLQIPIFNIEAFLRKVVALIYEIKISVLHRQ